MLLEPVYSGILRAFQALLLDRVLRIPASGEAMLQAWEVLIVIFDAEGGNDLVGVILQFLRVSKVVFRSDYLEWDRNGIDLRFFQHAWMSNNGNVDQVVP